MKYTTSANHVRNSIGCRLAIALLVLLAVAKPVLIDSLDPDCFWHLRVARQLLHQGIGPIVDELSFNSIREPWSPYSWLAEFGMLGVWHVAGWRGAVAVHAAMSAGFVLLVVASCRELQRTLKRTGELNIVLAAAAACVWSLAYLSFRPATLAIDLLALAAWLIFRDRRLHERSRAIWLLVPLCLLLTNVHLTAILLPIWLASLAAGAMWERYQGGVVREAEAPCDSASAPAFHRRGIAIEAWDTAGDEPDLAYGPCPNVAREKLPPAELERRSSRYTLLACLCAIAFLATPMLPGMLQSAQQYQFRDVMVSSPIIAEMRPFYDGAFGKVSLVLVVLTLAGCVQNRHRIRSGEWLWLAVMGLFLARLGRFSPLFAIVAAPMAAAFWPRMSDRPLRRRPVAVALSLLLAIGALRVLGNFPAPQASFGSWLNRNVPAASGYPSAAADFVDSHIAPKSGRMINEFNWGGYLAWRLGDRYQTFMDGRTQLHPPAFWHDAYLGDADSRRSLVEHTHADVAILPLPASLFGEPLRQLGWTTVWHDEQSQVMVPPTTVVAVDP